MGAANAATGQAKAGWDIIDDNIDLPPPLPPAPSGNTLPEVLGYLWNLALGDRNFWWRFTVAAGLLLLTKAAGITVPLLFKRAVDALADASAARSLMLLSSNPAAAVAAGTALMAASGIAMQAVALSGLATAARGLFTELRIVLFAPIAQVAGRRIALHLLDHVLSLDASFHLSRRTGALQHAIERGSKSVAMVYRALIFTFVPTIVELLLVAGLMWRSVCPTAAMLVAVTFVAYTGWTTLLTGLLASRRRDMNDAQEAANGKALDSLLNYDTVKLFGSRQQEAAVYDRYLRAYHLHSQRSEDSSALLNAGQAFILAAGLTGVLSSVVAQAAAGTVTAGDVVLANGLLLQLWAPLNFLGFFYRELRQSLVDMDKMFELLRATTSLPEGTRRLPPCSRGGAALDVRDVHFGYGPGREVLRGVSFRAAPGESVAIVGPSGSGKSTLVRLLLRAYDVTSGAILLDGVDVRELTTASLREATAVVPQEAALFNDSLANNIAYGRPHAALEQIEAAGRAAQLDAAVVYMPQGYETLVGERGLKLSGGERQRVALARAFLRAPRLLVCDEATSALDSRTEAGILRSLRDLATGRTSVQVAHRLSTIMHCDTIVVLEGGRVVEQGTHAGLVRARGIYAAMWALQQAEQQLEEKQTEKQAVNDSISAEKEAESSPEEAGTIGDRVLALYPEIAERSS